MRTLLLFIVFFIIQNTVGQKIDWINAPLNPIPLKYKAEHYNLKGDIYAFERFIFSKEGFLIYDNGLGKDHLIYDGDLLINSAGRVYTLNKDGYISSESYVYSGVKTVYSFTYNKQGLLTEVKNGSNILTTYTYNNNNQVIKQVTNGVVKRTFQYARSNNNLVVSETAIDNGKTTTTIKTYDNGDLISENGYKYEYKKDTKGNIISSFSNSIYYSDVSPSSEISLIYNPASISFDKLQDCDFFINNKEVSIISSKIINNTDVLIYHPLSEKYLIIKDAFNTAKNGKKQVFSTVYIDSPFYLDVSTSSKRVVYKGGELFNSVGAYREGSLKIYNQFNTYIIYGKFVNKTFFVKFDPSKNYSFYPLQQISPADNIFYVKSDKTGPITVVKGEVLKASDFTKLENNNDVILYKNNIPIYYLPNFKTAILETLYPGRLYNSATDSAKISSNSTTTATTTNSCISGDCSNGYGTLKTNTSTIEGFYTNGKNNGFAKERYNDRDTFSGFYKDGLRDGYGVFTWKKDGQVYFGQWKNGNMHGYGYVMNTSGKTIQAGYYENGKLRTDMLTGDFINLTRRGDCVGDCKNGFGLKYYEDKNSFLGFFENGIRQHVGFFKWKSTGDTFFGTFKNGLISGEGSYSFFKTNTLYDGEFMNERLHGLGIYSDSSGNIISKGDWEKGKFVSNTSSSIQLNTTSLNNSSNLSEEAKAFLELYNASRPVATHLKNLDAAWDGKNYTKETKVQKYTAIVEELYKTDKKASYEFMFYLYDTKNVYGVLPKLKTETRQYIREQANLTLKK